MYYKLEEQVNISDMDGKEAQKSKEEILKRLYVGFANKQKLETLRFFII